MARKVTKERREKIIKNFELAKYAIIQKTPHFGIFIPKHLEERVNFDEYPVVRLMLGFKIGSSYSFTREELEPNNIAEILNPLCHEMYTKITEYVMAGIRVNENITFCGQGIFIDEEIPKGVLLMHPETFNELRLKSQFGSWGMK